MRGMLLPFLLLASGANSFVAQTRPHVAATPFRDRRWSRLGTLAHDSPLLQPPARATNTRRTAAAADGIGADFDKSGRPEWMPTNTEMKKLLPVGVS